MPLQRIKLRPGINRSNTNYANEGGYYACDKVRFRFGFPQKIGGWVRYMNATYIGTVRSLFNWVTLTNTNILAIATNVKYYIESGNGLYDITPLRSTATLGTDPFSATAGSTIVTVTHSAHGAVSGDYVTFSGATLFAGLTSADLNAEFALTYVDANHYTITLPTPANTTTTDGGSAVSAAYQLNTTPNVSVPGLGWNAGAWGRGTWGSAASVATFSTLRLWSQESFGEDHVFCPRNGPLYYWKFSDGLNHRAVLMSSLAGASNVPLMASKLLLSTADRHLIAFGCNPIGSSVQDPLLIRWADTESLTQWTPSITNASGDLRLSSGNHIVTAIHLKQETLVFTDGSIFALQFIGAPDIFGLQPVADNISIISPQAVAVTGNFAFWMGNDKFYVYNGRAQTLPCTVDTHVFADINRTQSDQFFAGTNEGFSEIWWFYCSADSNEVDRYVIYNYDDQVWSYGSMNRSAWLDSPLKPNPIAANNGYLYYHEHGVDDDRVTPIHAWIESSDFNLGEGEDFCFVRRIIPDVMFVGSDGSTPTVQMTVTPRNAPGAAYKPSLPSDVARSVAVPVEEFTEVLDVRLRGRQLRFRIESDKLGTHWQLGTPRLDIQPDGKK